MTEAPVDDEFVREHTGLVRAQAARLRAQLELTTDLEDLVAYGMQGLLEAKARFDPERGVRFPHFAYYRIRGAILDGVREMAYLPRRTHVARRAAETLDRAAEEQAIARAASPEARDNARQALAAVDDILSKTCAAYLIGAVGQDEERDAPSTPEDETIANEDRARVLGALDVLEERERALVEGYYLEGRTLDEIGQDMGITKSWASRICSRALTKMRAVLEEA
ncbi:MAG: sigma-70 family RNA polymerase sigma factor [Sandaracinaceae bacterium]|nr:sigma-70 family RNA polymerase sigma factor [Sandaracinaceae bacterium]